MLSRPREGTGDFMIESINGKGVRPRLIATLLSRAMPLHRLMPLLPILFQTATHARGSPCFMV
jgi:hypothetical protein